MPAKQIYSSNMLQLPPFPEGWYFVASRKSVLKAELLQKTWMGENIVVWCDEAGSICVALAVCPHLGADLSPDAGGLVRDGCLVCPFHGFEFDVSGKCVATPFAPAPRAARLQVFETREILGMVFAWWGTDGRPPQWSLPEQPEAGSDWSEIGFQSVQFAGHPQETTENSVDLAHLRYVHGYDNVSRVGPITVDGPCLTSDFDFRRTQRIAGVKDIVMDVTALTQIFGLGYSFVQVHEKTIEMHARLWVLATPVDGNLIEMVLASQVREIRKPKRPIVGMRFLPLSLRSRFMNNFILTMQKHDVMQDVLIWKRKRYVTPPRLCRSDGEIGRFRRYCKQFYPDDRDSS